MDIDNQDKIECTIDEQDNVKINCVILFIHNINILASDISILSHMGVFLTSETAISIHHF